jgi:hypothetical protein
MDVSGAVLTEHAIGQLQKREITEANVCQVLTKPESVHPVRIGRVVAQAMIGQYLYRVFVDVDRTPAEVVTAYRTSQLAKYRRQP